MERLKKARRVAITFRKRKRQTHIAYFSILPVYEKVIALDPAHSSLLLGLEQRPAWQPSDQPWEVPMWTQHPSPAMSSAQMP